MFSILKNCQMVFQNWCIILQAHLKYTRELFSPHLHQDLLFSVFLIIATLVGFVTLACVSLTANGLEQLFTWLLSIRLSSLVKCLFSSLTHFQIGFFVFLFGVVRKSLWVPFPLHSSTIQWLLQSKSLG